MLSSPEKWRAILTFSSYLLLSFVLLREAMVFLGSDVNYFRGEVSWALFRGFLICFCAGPLCLEDRLVCLPVVSLQVSSLLFCFFSGVTDLWGVLQSERELRGAGSQFAWKRYCG